MDNLAKHLVHAPQFVITWTMFFGFGIIMYVIYAIKNKDKLAFRELLDYCVPFNIFTERSFHTDVKIYLIGKLTDGFVVIPALLLGASLCSGFAKALSSQFPHYTPMELTIFAAAICTIAMFIVVEFSDFLCHYVEHKVPFLWELHKVHHSAQSLNPLTSKRGHPLAMGMEGIVRGMLTAIPGGLFVFLFGISVVEAMSLSMIASKIFVIATLDPLKHSHLPIGLGLFDRVLISPHMHQIHHSKTQVHWDKNFGTNLSIFDWIIGTAYRPARGEKPVYGISGLSDATLDKYNSLQGAYVAPLQKSYKKIKKLFAGKQQKAGNQTSNVA